MDSTLVCTDHTMFRSSWFSTILACIRESDLQTAETLLFKFQFHSVINSTVFCRKCKPEENILNNYWSILVQFLCIYLEYWNKIYYNYGVKQVPPKKFYVTFWNISCQYKIFILITYLIEKVLITLFHWGVAFKITYHREWGLGNNGEVDKLFLVVILTSS